jgi:hypothetical protein
VQPRSDEKVVLSNLRVLEGAPALSEYWTLFDTNDGVLTPPAPRRRQRCYFP